MDVFEALADPVRRSLLRQLRAGPTRVVDLTAAHEVSRPAVSRHLRLLTEAGLTQVADHGRERHYALVRDGLGAVVEPVTELLTELLTEPKDPPVRSDVGSDFGAVVGPPITEHHLDALETEVRRTGRERRLGAARATSHEESA